MQDRVGPNRVGPWGLLQPIADGAKFLLKEEVIPDHVNKVLFVIAPTIRCFTTLLAFAVVPFGPVGEMPIEWLRFIIAPNVDIGIVFIFAITSLAVYGIILGGWASNNKYSALGSLRASAQVVSYEIPLGMSVVGHRPAGRHAEPGKDHRPNRRPPASGAGTSGLQPLACLIFFTSALAESNRLPFDLSECEQELVGGFHTEYSALKFALFFLGEYTHVITISFLTSDPVLRRLAIPVDRQRLKVHYAGAWLVKMLVLMTKVLLVIVVDHAHPLDDPAVPVRPTDGPRLEGADPAVDRQHGRRDVRPAIQLEPVVAHRHLARAVHRRRRDRRQHHPLRNQPPPASPPRKLASAH